MGFMFNFFRKKANAQQVDLEKFNREIGPYIAEGLMRVVFQTTEFTVLCIVNSAYVVLLHGIIDKTNGLTCGLGFRAPEFHIFMEVIQCQDTQNGTI